MKKSQPVKKARHFFETLIWNADVFMITCSQYSQYKTIHFLQTVSMKLICMKKQVKKKHRDEIRCKKRCENIARLERNKAIQFVHS